MDKNYHAQLGFKSERSWQFVVLQHNRIKRESHRRSNLERRWQKEVQSMQVLIRRQERHRANLEIERELRSSLASAGNFRQYLWNELEEVGFDGASPLPKWNTWVVVDVAARANEGEQKAGALPKFPGCYRRRQVISVAVIRRRARGRKQLKFYQHVRYQ